MGRNRWRKENGGAFTLGDFLSLRDKLNAQSNLFCAALANLPVEVKLEEIIPCRVVIHVFIATGMTPSFCGAGCTIRKRHNASELFLADEIGHVGELREKLDELLNNKEE